MNIEPGSRWRHWKGWTYSIVSAGFFGAGRTPHELELFVLQQRVLGAKDLEETRRIGLEIMEARRRHRERYS